MAGNADRDAWVLFCLPQFVYKLIELHDVLSLCEYVFLHFHGEPLQKAVGNLFGFQLQDGIKAALYLL